MEKEPAGTVATIRFLDAKPSSASRGIQVGELESIGCFLLWKQCFESIRRHGAMLKAFLLEDRHIDSAYRTNPRPNDFSLELIQFLMIPLRQFDKGNRLGNFDHTWQREGAKSSKAKESSRCAGANMASALAATVCQRMLDRMHAPSLLIQHQIVQNATNR